MCGRYYIVPDAEAWACVFELTAATPALNCNLAASYNVAPGQMVPVLRTVADSHDIEMVSVRWGLVPHWAREVRIGYKMINARSETAAEKPAFRQSIRNRRCLIPASGYYEWKATAGQKKKQAFAIRSRDGAPLMFAGLWESWNDPVSESTLLSCTIMTRAATPELEKVHQRMPVILSADRQREWLHAPLTGIGKIFDSCSTRHLEMIPVGSYVNSPVNNDERCLMPDPG